MRKWLQRNFLLQKFYKSITIKEMANFTVRHCIDKSWSANQYYRSRLHKNVGSATKSKVPEKIVYRMKRSQVFFLFFCLVCSAILTQKCEKCLKCILCTFCPCSAFLFIKDSIKVYFILRGKIKSCKFFSQTPSLKIKIKSSALFAWLYS